MKTYTADEWFALAESLYELMNHEMDTLVSGMSNPSNAQKMEAMARVFSMFRGEGFDGVRPAGMGDLQTKMYAMDSALWKKTGKSL